MREIRKLNKDGHQTSIITTNKIFTLVMIASYMFARWAQENFFRYMRLDFALDTIIQYSVDKLDDNIQVVNVEYNNLTYKIKKEREKLARRKTKLFENNQKNPLQESEQENTKWTKSILKLIEEVELIEKEVNTLIDKRKQTSRKIPLSQMPEKSRYNQLNNESKQLQNIIKMICYRAETSLANSLYPHYKRADEEVRTLIKSIIKTSINMEVDNENETLNITLYPLSNMRSYNAVGNICQLLNETNTKFPGTNFRLIYNIATY
jgi:hypothetical protein